MIPASGITREDMHALAHYIVQLPTRATDLDGAVSSLNDCELPWHPCDRHESLHTPVDDVSEACGHGAPRKSSRPRERVLRLSARRNSSSHGVKGRRSDTHGTSTDSLRGNGHARTHQRKDKGFRIASPQQEKTSRMTVSELEESSNGQELTHQRKENRFRKLSPEQEDVGRMTASELKESTNSQELPDQQKKSDFRISSPQQEDVSRMTASELEESMNGRGHTHRYQQENIHTIPLVQVEMRHTTTSGKSASGRERTHQHDEGTIRTLASEHVDVGTLVRDDGAPECKIAVGRDALPCRFNATSQSTRSSWGPRHESGDPALPCFDVTARSTQSSREPEHASSDGSRSRYNVKPRSTWTSRESRGRSSDATPPRFNVTSRSTRSSREPRDRSSDATPSRFNVTSRSTRSSREPRDRSSDATPRCFNVTSRSSRSSREPRDRSSDATPPRFNVTSRSTQSSREPQHSSSNGSRCHFNATSRPTSISREPRHACSDATPRRVKVTSRPTSNAREGHRDRKSGASSLSSRGDASPCVFNIYQRRSSPTSAYSLSSSSSFSSSRSTSRSSASSASSASSTSPSTLASDVCFNIYQHPRASARAHSMNGSDESKDASESRDSSFVHYGHLRHPDTLKEGHGKENSIRRVPTPLASSHGSGQHTVPATTASPAQSRRPDLTARHGPRCARRDKNAENFSFKPSLDLTKHKNEELLGEGRVFRSVEERLAYMGQSYAKRRAKMQIAQKEQERKAQGDGFRVAAKSEWYCQVARRPALAARTIEDSEKKQSTLEKARKEKVDLEMEECVFRPDICPRSRKMMNASSALLGDFTERQCEWKKRKDEKLRKVLEKDILQQDSFSFHPRISKVSRQMSSKWQRSPLDSKRSVRALIAQKPSSPSRDITSHCVRELGGEKVCEQTHAAVCDTASCVSDQKITNPLCGKGVDPGMTIQPCSKGMKGGDQRNRTPPRGKGIKGGPAPCPSQGRRADRAPSGVHKKGVNGGGCFPSPRSRGGLSQANREVHDQQEVPNDGDRISFDAFLRRTERRKKSAPARRRTDTTWPSPKPPCDEGVAERHHKTSRAQAPNDACERTADVLPDAHRHTAMADSGDEEPRAEAMPINEVVFDTSLAGILDMVESAAQDAAF